MMKKQTVWDLAKPYPARPPAPSGPEGEAVNQRSRAYQGFRQQIIDARIRPGQFVSQRELMDLSLIHI